MNCPVSKQIAQHCDESEKLCPVCGSTMTYSDYDIDVIECDSCDHEIDTSEGL